jgi:hypothetical protein
MTVDVADGGTRNIYLDLFFLPYTNLILLQ